MVAVLQPSRPRAAARPLPQAVHPDKSPLLLCDTCPRSFHQACLGMSAAELPSGDWCCPRCADATQAALRRVMGQEARRQAAGDRAVHREKAAEDKMLKRLISQQERRKVGRGRCGGRCGGQGRSTAEQPPCVAAHLHGGSAAPALACAARPPCLALALGPYCPQPDDFEVLEEEKENKNRLEIRWVTGDE